MAKSTAGRIGNVLWNVLFNPLATWISFLIIRKQHYYNDSSMGDVRQVNGVVLVSSFLGAMLGLALFFLLSPLFNPLGLLGVPALVGIGYAMVWAGSVIFKTVAIEILQFLHFKPTHYENASAEENADIASPDKDASAEENAELNSQNLLTSLARAVLGDSRQGFLTLMRGNTKAGGNIEVVRVLPPVAPDMMAPAHAQPLVPALGAVVTPPTRFSPGAVAFGSTGGAKPREEAHDSKVNSPVSSNSVSDSSVEQWHQASAPELSPRL